MIKLATVTLPDNMRWTDEYAWSPVDQSTTRTLSGALVVEETARQSGRPITLEMWASKTTVDSLKTLEASVATEMTLQFDTNDTHTVLWRREGDTPAVEATPLFSTAPSLAPDLFTLTLRLMEA